jgi:hypothetical protein
MKELKEAIYFGISFLEAGFSSLEDGKFDFTDITKLWEPMSRAGDAIEGSSKIIGEVQAMDEAAKKSLMEEVKKDFDIKDDILEARIEGAIQLVLGIAMYGMTFTKKKKD